MHVILDLSRLLFAVRRATPSGIDRVELAYAVHFLARAPAHASFVAANAWGRFAQVPQEVAAPFLERVARSWTGEPGAAASVRRAALAIHARLLLGRGCGALATLLRERRRVAFLLVSHRALDRAAPIEALTARGAVFVPFVHDLIPLTHPEYARPPQTVRHRRRVATVARVAGAVIANSAATAAALAPHLPEPGPRVVVAPLGLDLPVPERGRSGSPLFLAIGTIEPRKNHLLLLHIWREFAGRLGPAAPRLLLIGRRGWENENILDLLDRCEGLRGLVHEAGPLPDAAVAAQLAGATALLFPSFVEGYGLPLAEALAAGVPAICSDIPALREVGGEVPDYLDPLDGIGWRRAILDHARPDSPLRHAQQARLTRWRPPSWTAHFGVVERLLAELPAAAAPRLAA